MCTKDEKPLVSVLLPINRQHEFLQAAIKSIEEQDYFNLEVLILDNSHEGLEFTHLPTNFIVHKLPGDSGLSKTLNFGIEKARGKYIFRMDSDDIALPERLSIQIKILEENKNIDILGSGIEIIGTGDNRNVSTGDLLNRTEANGKVMEYLLYKNPLFHPTVAMRTESIFRLHKFYKSKYDGVEDLDFWVRASRTLRIENIPDTLLQYRIHKNQTGTILSIKSELLSNLIRIRHSVWVICHIKGLRTKASRALARNIFRFLRACTSYFASNKKLFQREKF